MTRMERKFRPTLNEAYRQTAEVLANGCLVEAPHSVHMVMYNEPQMVVDDIKRIMDMN